MASLWLCPLATTCATAAHRHQSITTVCPPPRRKEGQSRCRPRHDELVKGRLRVKSSHASLIPETLSNRAGGRASRLDSPFFSFFFSFFFKKKLLTAYADTAMESRATICIRFPQSRQTYRGTRHGVCIECACLDRTKRGRPFSSSCCCCSPSLLRGCSRIPQMDKWTDWPRTHSRTHPSPSPFPPASPR